MWFHKVELLNYQAYLNLQTRAHSKEGGAKNSSAFLKAATTTLLHTISESEKSAYVAHINSYLGEDSFLKKYLPLDPATNDLFNLAKDGVLLWYADAVLSLSPHILFRSEKYNSLVLFVVYQTLRERGTNKKKIGL